MATLYFVRHGQASFGADDYDQLSALGRSQAEALGAHWAARGVTFNAVFRGTLKRHQQTLDGLLIGAEGAGAQQAAPNAASVLEAEEKVSNTHFVQHPRHLFATNNIAIRVAPELNEYDSEALMRARLALHPQHLPAATTPDGYKAHFRVLRDALGDWIEGRTTPPPMPSFHQFRAGIAGVMDLVRAEHGAQSQANVLVVSSGGPISTAVMHALGAPAGAMIDLNYQMRNTAVTCFQVSRSKITLSGFNHLPHLDVPERADWVTST